MKKLTLLMAGFVIALASCQKEEPVIEGHSLSANQSKTIQTSQNTPPATFVKKVLVEELSGTTYGDIPASNEMLADIMMQYPDQVYIASMHNNDGLETGSSDLITSTIASGNPVTYPASMINRQDLSGTRFLSYVDYNKGISKELAEPADCGIAISSVVSGGMVTINVSSAFNYSSSMTHTMNVYLVEDMITDVTGSLAQANNFNTTPGSSFYMMGNPIAGYTHNNVVRKIVTPAMGEVIKPAAVKPGGYSLQTFRMDMPGKINKANCYIIAFITSVDNNGVANEVLNVQKAKLGVTKTWN